MDPLVAEATGNKDLAENIDKGVSALNQGDMDEATRRLGEALKIAQKQGNAEVTRKLGALLETDDKGTIKIGSNGKVTVRRGANKSAGLELQSVSVRTKRKQVQ